MSLKGHGAGKMMAVNEVQERFEVQQQSPKSFMFDTEQESALPYWCEYTNESETVCAVLDWALLFMGLYNSIAERYEKKVMELLHCDKSNMKAI